MGKILYNFQLYLLAILSLTLSLSIIIFLTSSLDFMTTMHVVSWLINRKNIFCDKFRKTKHIRRAKGKHNILILGNAASIKLLTIFYNTNYI